MSNILEYKGRTFIIGSYAVSKALKSIGFSLTNIGEAIDTHYLELINAVIYYAAEYPFYKDGKATDFQEKDVYALLDETGGYNGEIIQKITALMLNSINPDGKSESQAETSMAKKKSSPSRTTS